MSATAVSDWPMPTVSTRITSKPAASQSSMVSRVLAATPPSVPAAGEGRMKAFGSADKPRHPRLVAEDRAAGAGGGGIDREHRDLVPVPGEIGAERVDGGRLADPRGAGDADARGLAGIRQQILHELAGLVLMVGPFRLDERDGARQHRPLAGTDAAWRSGPCRWLGESERVRVSWRCLKPTSCGCDPVRSANSRPWRPKSSRSWAAGGMNVKKAGGRNFFCRDCVLNVTSGRFLK